MPGPGDRWNIFSSECAGSEQFARAVVGGAPVPLHERGDGPDKRVHLVRSGADEALVLTQHLGELLLAEADALVASEAGKEVGVAAAPDGLTGTPIR